MGEHPGQLPELPELPDVGNRFPQHPGQLPDLPELHDVGELVPQRNPNALSFYPVRTLQAQLGWWKTVSKNGSKIPKRLYFGIQGSPKADICNPPNIHATVKFRSEKGFIGNLKESNMARLSIVYMF